MNCPECGSDQTTVRDNVRVDDHNIMLRKYFCITCEHVFFTVETIISKTPGFRKMWYENHRTTLRDREKKEKKNGKT